MLEIRGLHKDYEGQPLLRGVGFKVRARETVCLLGPSGSGKSTLLRIIAGLETPEQGQVLWNAKDLAPTPPHLRDFGLVFQDYVLFPHLNVRDNVAFGLRMRGQPQAEVATRVSEVLGIVDLGGFEQRVVTDLSGGEQQRVALARAGAASPLTDVRRTAGRALPRPARRAARAAADHPPSGAHTRNLCDPRPRGGLRHRRSSSGRSFSMILATISGVTGST